MIVTQFGTSPLSVMMDCPMKGYYSVADPGGAPEARPPPSLLKLVKKKMATMWGHKFRESDKFLNPLLLFLPERDSGLLSTNPKDRYNVFLSTYTVMYVSDVKPLVNRWTCICTQDLCCSL